MSGYYKPSIRINPNTCSWQQKKKRENTRGRAQRTVKSEKRPRGPEMRFNFNPKFSNSGHTYIKTEMKESQKKEKKMKGRMGEQWTYLNPEGSMAERVLSHPVL